MKANVQLEPWAEEPRNFTQRDIRPQRAHNPV